MNATPPLGRLVDVDPQEPGRPRAVKPPDDTGRGVARPMRDDSPAARRVDRHLVSLIEPRSFEAEQYLKLRHVVEELKRPGEGLVVGIGSAAPGDGKSLTAFNLAGALAQDRTARVLLVDADLRRESATWKSMLPGCAIDGPGLTDAILDRKLAVPNLVRRLTRFNLQLLPAGTPSAAPYELLRAREFGELLAELRQHHDHVVIDAPPILPVSDCQAIGKWVDGFLLVVAAHRTSRRMLQEALDLMDQDKVFGLVFNRDDLVTPDHYGYHAYRASAAPRDPPSRPRRG